MSQQIINIGTAANDGTGDTIRVAFGKAKDNFSELYTTIGTFTAAGLTLMTAANAAAQRTALGLGTAATQNTGDFAAASHTHTFASLTSKPTTLAGYGITDGASANGSAILLPRWTAARAKVRSGVSDARILCIGDSTTSGFGAAGNGYTGAHARAYPATLAAALVAGGIPASAQSFMGSNQGLVSANAYDPRVSLSGGFSVSTFKSFGRTGFQSTTNGAVLAFTPGTPFDCADIYFFNTTSNGDFTVNIGGSTLQTVNETGAESFRKVTVSGFELGEHTLNIVASSSTFLYIIGVVVRDSVSSAVHVVNAGWDAAQSSNLIDTQDSFGSQKPYAQLPATVTFAADLVIVNIGINDAGSSVSPATFEANLTTLLESLSGVSDVLLVIPALCGETPESTNQPAIHAVIRSLATAYGAAIIDLSTRFISYSSANALGLMYDTLHPSRAGYQANAEAIAGLLMQ